MTDLIRRESEGGQLVRAACHRATVVQTNGGDIGGVPMVQVVKGMLVQMHNWLPMAMTLGLIGVEVLRRSYYTGGFFLY
uniref:Uncharacterized protein n=1 Tax=Thermomicrobium roseum TaxID=500 RepID=A0A7C2B0G4_THERO